jgi:thiamine-monophosphate kinase
LSTPSSVGDAGEHALIDLIRRRLPPAPSWIHVGVGDDAAVVEPARNTLDVFTTDALVEGVHFDRAFTPPEAIGHRALAVNLSDLAAMGATPRAALLSLVLPAHLLVSEVAGIIDGLLALAARHRVQVIGGNVTQTSGPIVIDVTAIGSLRRRQALTRAGARPGDEVWVSGWIGSAAAGLGALAHGDPAGIGLALEIPIAAYLTPEPRVRLGQLLGRNRAATACIDLSDGLADGLRQLAAASGIGMVVTGETIPIAPGARQWFTAQHADPVRAALRGGDDYELLFTVARRRRSRFASVRRLIGDLPVTRIGRVTDDGEARIEYAGGVESVGDGYEHFR